MDDKDLGYCWFRVYKVDLWRGVRFGRLMSEFPLWTFGVEVGVWIPESRA